MTCHDARERFSALLDEALDTGARVSLDAHLGGCAECRRELEAFRRTVALVRGIEPARAPAGFVDRVLAAARPEPWPRRLVRRLFLPWPLKLPLEAAAVVIVGVLAVWLFQQMPEPRQFARTDAPAPVTSGREPAPQTAPASPPSAVGETKAERPAELAGPRRNAEAPAAPSPPAQAPADKRKSTDALGAAPRAEEARGQIAREGFRDQVPAAPPGPQAPVESQREVAVKLRKEAPAPAEGKRAQVQSAAAERDKDIAARQALGLIPGAPASQVAGRLAASDHERAERDLQALVAKLGGTTLWRRGDGRVTVVDVEVPRDKYAQFIAEVARLGRWTAEREARELPESVRVQIQLD